MNNSWKKSHANFTNCRQIWLSFQFHCGRYVCECVAVMHLCHFQIILNNSFGACMPWLLAIGFSSRLAGFVGLFVLSHAHTIQTTNSIRRVHLVDCIWLCTIHTKWCWCWWRRWYTSIGTMDTTNSNVWLA